jgi:hypothetical protein
MEYITVKDGKISGHFCGNKLPDGAVQVTDFWGNTGDPVTWYDDKWQRKDEIELYRAGVKELPAGYRLNDGKTAIVEMSEAEKIQAGMKKLPDGMKIENGVIAVKTASEKLASGEITQEAYDTQVKESRGAEIRQHLEAIDTATVRPLRAVLAGMGTDSDKAKLAELEIQAQDLRKELEELI